MYNIRGTSLTHWGRVTHICVSKLTTIGSDNGLSPSRRQAIIWTKNVRQNSFIFIQENAFENVVCERASIQSRPQWVKVWWYYDWRISANFRATTRTSTWTFDNDSLLTHWGRNKMAAFSQTTLSNAFSWMKITEFLLKFHWSLFLRVQLTISHHWFR